MYNMVFRNAPFYFSNCCGAVKEREKRLAKMCAKSAQIDYSIFLYNKYN